MNPLKVIFFFFQAIGLLFGGINLNEDTLDDQWEHGTLFGGIPRGIENPFVETITIGHNDSITVEKYLIRIPILGVFITKWHIVPESHWIDFHNYFELQYAFQGIENMTLTNVQIYTMKGVDPKAICDFIGMEVIPISEG